MLNDDDSKRVADALIDLIERTDINGTIDSTLLKVLIPGRNGWVADWLPLTFEDMCNKIVNIIGDASARIGK